MRQVLLAASAVIALAAGAAMADPLDDAKAGMGALDKGDNPAAIKLFTSALDSGRLTRSDQELAHVKRAEAYLATSDGKAALDDANAALNLQPSDAEASATRDRAQALLAPPPAPAAPAAPTAADTARADYVAAVAKYEAEKQADADNYAKQMSDYDAQVKAQNDKHQAEMVAWQSDVAACKAGDQTKCGTAMPAAPSPVAKPAQAAQQPAPKPVVPVASKPAPAPAKPGTQQAANASTTKPVKKPDNQGPLERQIIY